VGFVGYELYRWRAKAPKRKIDRLFDEARAASGAEGDALLARFCEECARRIQKSPREAHVLNKWGVALWWRAAKLSGAEANALYEQADKKFAQAQAITPNDGELRANRADALRWRAALHPDEEGRRLLIQVCEHCQQRLGIHASVPHDARMFGTWGMALWWLAAREKGGEARRLYDEADEKFERCCALAPDQTEMAVNRADAMFWRSALENGAAKLEILRRVCGQCEDLAGKGTGARACSRFGVARFAGWPRKSKARRVSGCTPRRKRSSPGPW
jgi:hypothetical protein